MSEQHALKVAITGGIGSGKSYVCQCLASRGIAVYDCDAAAKRLMQESEVVRQRLTALIGPDAYRDGKLCKATVAAYLMQGDDCTRRVNEAVHPVVAQDFMRSGMDWLEAAILFESGFERYVDRVVCVTAPQEVRIRRVMQRDGITRPQVLQWMAKQWPQSKVLAMSHFQVVNDGVADIHSQLDTILRQLGGMK